MASSDSTLSSLRLPPTVSPTPGSRRSIPDTYTGRVRRWLAIRVHTHCLSITVPSCIEWLECGRIVSDKQWAVSNMGGEVVFMFCMEITPPLQGRISMEGSG